MWDGVGLKKIIIEYWNKLQKNRDDRVVANAETYLLDESRGKSYERVKSYSGLCWDN